MILLAVAACAGESDPEGGPIRWKAQAGMPANSWSYEYQFAKFAELVNERSGGRLVIEVFPPGTIVDAYDSLSDDLKKVVEDAAEEAMIDYVETITRNLEEMLETAQKEHGVTIVTLPDQEYAKILKAAAPILDLAAGRSLRSAEIINLMKEYLLEKGSPMSRFLQ
jgi:TRAP-type C4-dicarboxylate transport system substrate-binding protein